MKEVVNEKCNCVVLYNETSLDNIYAFKLNNTVFVNKCDRFVAVFDTLSSNNKDTCEMFLVKDGRWAQERQHECIKIVIMTGCKVYEFIDTEEFFKWCLL